MVVATGARILLSAQAEIKVLLFDTDASVQTRVGLFLRGDNLMTVRPALTREIALNLINGGEVNVVLVGTTLANANGIEISKLIRKAKPDIKIIMMAAEANPAEMLASLTAPANGFCLKEISAERLRLAIQWVAAGGLWLDSVIVKSVLKELKDGRSSGSIQSIAVIEALNQDEINILKALSKGKFLPDIFQQMKVDPPQQRAIEMSLLQQLSSLAESSRAALGYLAKPDGPDARTLMVCLACRQQYPSTETNCKVDGTRLIAVKKSVGEGSTIANRYKLGKSLAQGGNGVIYPGEDIHTNQRVAVKVMHEEYLSNSQYVERFRREAECLAALEHPHIVKLIDYGIDTERAYLVMEFVEGMDLHDVLQKVGEIPFERAVPIFIQVCNALGFAHQAGLIHRDLSPANIVLDASYDDIDFAKLIDFGLVKVVEQPGRYVQRLTKTGMICGTPTYMSPEQCQGKELDFRSDIYSIGCVMYEVLTGTPPLMGPSTKQTLLSHLHAQPQSMRIVAPGANIPEVLDQLVLKTLQKFPEDRQSSMAQLTDELDRVYQMYTA
jgi:serine/threonine-protein kinase